MFNSSSVAPSSSMAAGSSGSTGVCEAVEVVSNWFNVNNFSTSDRQRKNTPLHTDAKLGSLTPKVAMASRLSESCKRTRYKISTFIKLEHEIDENRTYLPSSAALDCAPLLEGVG